MELMDMPFEIVEKILESLHLLEDIKNASRTCTTLYKASQSPNLLKRIQIVVKSERQMIDLIGYCSRKISNVRINSYFEIRDSYINISLSVYLLVEKFYRKYSSSIISITFSNVNCFFLVERAIETLVNLTSVLFMDCDFIERVGGYFINTKITDFKVINCSISLECMKYILHAMPNLDVISYDNYDDNYVDTTSPIICYLIQNSNKVKCLVLTVYNHQALQVLLQIETSNLQYFHLAVKISPHSISDQTKIKLKQFCLKQEQLVYFNCDYMDMASYSFYQLNMMNLLDIGKLKNVKILYAFDQDRCLISPDNYECFWNNGDPARRMISTSKCLFSLLEEPSKITDLKIMMIDRLLEERHLIKLKNLTCLNFICIMSEELLQGIFRYLLQLQYLFLSDDISKIQLSDSALTGYSRRRNRPGFLSISKLQNLRKLHISKRYYNQLTDDSIIHLEVNLPHLSQVAIYGSPYFSPRLSYTDVQFTVTYGKRPVLKNQTYRNSCDFFSLP